jgi:hypothetical protein
MVMQCGENVHEMAAECGGDATAIFAIGRKREPQNMQFRRELRREKIENRRVLRELNGCSAERHIWNWSQANCVQPRVRCVMFRMFRRT